MLRAARAPGGSYGARAAAPAAVEGLAHPETETGKSDKTT